MTNAILPVEKETVFIADTYNEVWQSLANYMPGGRLFEAKNITDSNMRKLLGSLAFTILQLELDMQKLADEMDIQRTNFLIEEWEKVVGIPDTCFRPTPSTPIDMRRKWVIVKLTLMNTTTADDWIYLAAYLGVTIEIRYGVEYSEFPLAVPFVLASGLLASRYTMVIIVENVIAYGDMFPLPVPFTIGTNSTQLLQCIFSKIKPADVRLVFINKIVP